LHFGLSRRLGDLGTAGGIASQRAELDAPSHRVSRFASLACPNFLPAALLEAETSEPDGLSGEELDRMLEAPAAHK